MKALADRPAILGGRPHFAGGLLLGLCVFGAIAFAALGVWQLERRVGKLALIARVADRVHAAPSAAPGPAEWPQISREASEYRHVTMQGRFLRDRETLTRALTELGAGYWVMTPFRTDQGFLVLVNRGFTPSERKDALLKAEDQLGGETRITGLLRVSEPKGGFLRSNDPGRDLWYSRDVAAIAAQRNLHDVAPYFIDAEGTAVAGSPVPGLTVIAFPNNHLIYAITWFILAALSGGAIYNMARDNRRVDEARETAGRARIPPIKAPRRELC